MLRWAGLFLIIAIVAAIFGFGGIVAAAVQAAVILFWIAIVLIVISFVLHMTGGLPRGPG